MKTILALAILLILPASFAQTKEMKPESGKDQSEVRMPAEKVEQKQEANAQENPQNTEVNTFQIGPYKNGEYQYKSPATEE